MKAKGQASFWINLEKPIRTAHRYPSFQLSYLNPAQYPQDEGSNCNSFDPPGFGLADRLSIPKAVNDDAEYLADVEIDAAGE